MAKHLFWHSVRGAMLIGVYAGTAMWLSWVCFGYPATVGQWILGYAL